ncbi:MAG: hypothetical protein NTY38_24220 [Acidobacteria bacterium]|nr:hypothetical protein [Acidobacteriota bacterium]
MKITAIDTYIAGNPWKNWVFAKVSTDEGLYGIGEGTVNYFGKTVETAIHELKPLILGLDPFQVEIVTQKLVRLHFGTSSARPPTSPSTTCGAAAVMNACGHTPTAGIAALERRRASPRRRNW